MLIKDLIHLKNIRSIIQLGRQEDLNEVQHSFVVTEDIKLALDDFSQRLLRHEGGGIFLKGHYGTGKSHLLSWIQQEAPQGWPNWKSPSELSFPSHHTLGLSLIQFPADQSLEHIVLSQLDLKTRGHRGETYEGWLTELKLQGKAGWMIIFDELSEFLKSKASPSALAEDIRFLQFLSEFGKEHGCWVIGAIQEDLEGIGNADRETSLKLKDRFSIRWNLSSLHVEQMIPTRLIEKKEGASTYLDRYFLRCQELWPQTFTRHPSFLATYPLHPGTLGFLMNLGPLFSEHRGALRFTQDMLAGTWNPEKVGFLEHEVKELITPDLLFDYFLNRFNENLELKEYYHKAWLHLQARVLELLEPRDHELGLRAIKIIILATVDPKREGIQLDDLHGMLMLRIKGDYQLGRRYLEEQVFARLLARVNYLKEEHGRFLIDLRHQSMDMLDRIIDKRRQNLSIGSSSVWQSLFTLLDEPPLELKSLWDNPKSLGPVVYLNTLRTLKLAFGTEHPDADILIALPGSTPEKNKPQQLAWTPRAPSLKEEEQLLQAAAILELIRETPQTSTEQHARSEAIKRQKAEHGVWRTSLQQLFRDGRWHLGPLLIQGDMEWHASQRFENLLEGPVYELLTQRHPLFRSISPKLPYYNERCFAALIEGLVIPGELSESEMKTLHLEDALRGLALPLGIAQKVRQQYRFVWEPLQTPLVEAFCHALKTHSTLKEALTELETGPWGLPLQTGYFLAWAAIASGHFQAYRQNEPLSTGKISLHNLETIDELKAIETLEPSQHTLLCQHPFFSSCDQSYSGLSLEKQLWTHTQKQTEPILRWLGSWDSFQCEDAWQFCKSSFVQHQNTLSEFQDLIQLAKTAQDGLLSLLEHHDLFEQTPKALMWGKRFQTALKHHEEQLPYLWHQLHDEYFEQCPAVGTWLERQEDRKALIRDIQQWEDHENTFDLIEGWVAQARHWLQDYLDFYTEEHQKSQRTDTDASLEIFVSELLHHHPSFKTFQPTPACSRRLDIELKSKPYCRCGFVPQASSPDHEGGGVANELIQHCLQTFAGQSFYGQLQQALHEQNWNLATVILKTARHTEPPKRTRSFSLSQNLGKLKGKSLSRQQLLQAIDDILAVGGDTLWNIED